ncbi:hypothetical protein C499_08442 [Halogeometricum borinquense DSM 11551]|uniref:Cardiolipin synthase N-terminal domain-containing protein n=2 Tax=Halogeometricum borinquense TaxID=60847 RepID=E4NMK1_HALBP|nr:PLDc N-terminal domain-containing protein [Halogeometricum borinquense]ADQ68499.1 hypothetical protein Hbor_29600 [Halogeometricum borinquense DSM 11551]ELY27858.1 hypothetical protein C499_08442 [Halogeometricum borinquense DSM 11551]RYJ14973.1 hypothetical protein ELS19_14120 [Halogeometricum borinquense]
MATTRSPLAVLAGLVLVAFIPLVVMWVTVMGWDNLGYLLYFAIYFVVIHILLPSRVYIHARDHGSNAKLAWTALAFFIPLVGALVYFLVNMAFRRIEAAG